MKRAALHNLGCKVNAYETEAMRRQLQEAGYEIVDFTEEADVYVVNTCSVTNIADRKSRQLLHRARRRNPDAVIAAAGCYVQTAAKDILKEGIADIVIGNNKKKNLTALLEKYDKKRASIGGGDADGAAGERGFFMQAVDMEDMAGVKEYERLSITRTAEHTRAFIKIQDGCSQFCSYCIIPYTRGRVRSRNPQDVIEEIRHLAEGGYKEAVLTGIHLSSYGMDFGAKSGDGLLHLLGEIQKIKGIQRIRLGSLEPGIITEAFAASLAQMDKICPHFHLSLQSGCDAVLKRMNRRYDTAEYAAHCEILRKAFHNPAITTDVIVGFPGESEEEFRMTQEFVQKIRFYEMHIFKYSKRKGTKAAEMQGQVPDAQKTQRSAALAAVGERMSQEYRRGQIGQVRSVLLEEPFLFEGEQYYTGYTKEYVKTAVKSTKDRANSLAEGKIIRQLTGDVYLMVEF